MPSTFSLNTGTLPIDLTIPSGEARHVFVTVDGANSGACIPSLEVSLEELEMLWSAHVDSFGVVRVVILNQGDESLRIVGTLKVLNIEYQ